jgi:prepilin-type N-terminal cleavage/methylation domain-containing protein
MIHTTPIANCVLARTSPERELRAGFAHQQPVDVTEHVPELPLGAGDASHSVHHSALAFTLVELMVAIAVTSILIVAVNQIFGSVSDGVSRGLALSEIMASARVIGDQIERDFEEAVGPIENGILVIIDQRLGPYHLISDDDYNDNGNVDSGEPSRQLRSDQIVFIRRRADAEPMGPSGSSGYATSSDAAYLKTWYGHGQRTDASGVKNGALGTDENQFAGDWILARQALFLDNQPNGSNADGAFYNATWSGSDLGSGLPKVLHVGWVDVAEAGLAVEDNNGGAIVGGDEDTTAVKASRRLWKSLGPDDYSLRAYDFAYLTERLGINPTPSGLTFETWQVAQMHGYLGGHISDFVVEFAGDYDGATGLDKEASGAITWYGLNNAPPAGAFESAAGSTASQRPIYDDRGADDRRYVFRHGSGNTNWPYLIRFRYRVHDARGKLSGADGDLGIWFEQIVTVPRD